LLKANQFTTARVSVFTAAADGVTELAFELNTFILADKDFGDAHAIVGL
jgi:hypothetical protein